MTQPHSESTQFSNVFGMVTERRITYYTKFGWLSGRSRQDVPLKHVTSIGVEVHRYVLRGIVFTLIGIVLLALTPQGGAIVFLLSVPALVIGIVSLWGFPYVVINTAGTDITGTRGWPWDKGAAEQFAAAVRAQLFRD